MAQFTAYYNERGGEDAIPYLLDVQSDWVETGSRVVVPLVRRLRYGPLYSRLNPVFTISDTEVVMACLLYTSPSPRDRTRSRMPSSA